MSKRSYITTAIDYPNAAPHMGHVLEKVLADVVARWMRLSGQDVRFQIGTDEHGIKIQQTAQKQGVTPAELVDRNVPLFAGLYDRLGISYDNFIRTTNKHGHWPTVAALWKKLEAAGALEKRSYSGYYCVGCERFVTKKDLVDGLCPDHGIAPQEITEENWFFLLKREEEWLANLLTQGVEGQRYEIVPESRAHETLALLKRGLEDVSFSRPVTSLSWGIPVPGDDAQVMYVWCDALTNYISGLGALTDHADMRYWDDAEVTHVIGKDIARFHALIWPAMLKNAGIRAPDRLLIHGHLKSDGQKMSKSLGNVVDPVAVIDKYGVDALRFYLAHEIPVGNDGDFSWERFGEIYDSKLRNQLGNLLNRVLVLLTREGSVLLYAKDTVIFRRMVSEAREASEKAMPSFGIHVAVGAAVTLVEKLNVLMQESAPWKMTGQEKVMILSSFAEALRQVSLMLLPFIPETAQKMSVQLGVPYAGEMLEKDFVITEEMSQWGGVRGWEKVGEPAILFAPVETEEKTA
jgi:methionyl-tRNA synthetase